MPSHRDENLGGVLIVDDSPANLLALTAVLEPLGVRVVEAHSGLGAIELIRCESFAVMLLDVQMPELDGFETAKRVRLLENGRELPILFLTAIHADEKYARRGYASGAADYITKPFDADILRARVRAFVDLFQRREVVRRIEVETRTRERDEALRRLVAFERIATAALETNDLDALLRQLLEIFIGAADVADSATILLREGDALHVRASAGLARTQVPSRFAVKKGEGFVGRIAESCQPLALEDLQRPSRGSFPDVDALRARGTRGVFGVPLMNDGEVLGVAHIGSSRADTFPDPDKRLFVAMVERAAWAVQKHLRHSRMHDVLNAAPALITILSGPHLECEFMNPAARARFGGRDLVGALAANIGFNVETIELLKRVRDSGEATAHDELPVTTDWEGEGERTTRFLNVSLQPLRSSSGIVERVIMFAVDVTAQVRARRAIEAHEAERADLLEREREARAEAELANRAKDDFLATVSHELRTPLNAVLGWTASARLQATPEVDRALAVIERNAQAQARIIEDVLDLSRIRSGKLRLEMRAIPADATIDAAVDAVRPTADAKAVALSSSLEPATICADPDRLQQIVSNLLSNAIKFTPQGGTVSVTASVVDGELVVRVEDSGEGIREDFLPYIFEPFRQADGSTTRRHGGLGLGLGIVRQLVQAHGGTIRAESAGPNLGSTFTATLPLYPAPTAPLRTQRRARATHGETRTRLDSLRVLVVDDEEDARSLLENVFASRGATVATASSAAQAFDEFERFRPDVVVSDVAMPEIDGYAFVRRLRTLPPERGGHTPAIALTAYARTEDTQRAFPAGFQRHVPKPVDLERLVSTVAHLGLSFHKGRVENAKREA
jgi:signal transduction histidine kinase/DNA-binding response OmpR family regulator